MAGRCGVEQIPARSRPWSRGLDNHGREGRAAAFQGSKRQGVSSGLSYGAGRALLGGSAGGRKKHRRWGGAVPRRRAEASWIQASRRGRRSWDLAPSRKTKEWSSGAMVKVAWPSG
uniref:Uncharacterized protein n=1 Tax=Zea mays TaxID=4577 RepID=A0A804RH99_MAIZE